MNITIIQSYMKLIHLAERLKMELRHSWLSNGRQESVAEHSWRLALMVILFAPHLEQPIDVEKALKMAVLHDLVEAITGDIPTFEESERQRNKQIEEQKAIRQIREILNDAVGEEIYTVWCEFESLLSYEAKFVNALDKVEVIIAHTEADISTWLPWEKEYNRDGAMRHCQFDEVMQALSRAVQEEVRAKLSAESVNVQEI